MERPRAHAAEQVRVTELVLAGDRVADVAERPVVRIDAVRRTGIDHPGDRVVPQVLLVRRALGLDVHAVRGTPRVGAYDVPGVTTTDTRRLHPSVGGQV